jgi:hypothetical protein
MHTNMIYSEQYRRPAATATSPPDRVAKAIARCVEGRRREIVVSLTGKLFAYLGLHFPRTSDLFLSLTVPEPLPADE